MFKMINYVQENKNVGQVNVSDLAEELNVSVPAISRKLKCFEEKGYIQRFTDKNNRRNTNVILTDKGYKIFKEAESIVETFLDRVFNKMGEDDIEELIRIANKLYTIMEEEVGKLAKDN